MVSINLPFEPTKKVFPSIFNSAKNLVLIISTSNDEGYFLKILYSSIKLLVSNNFSIWDFFNKNKLSNFNISNFSRKLLLCVSNPLILTRFIDCNYVL